MIALWLKLIAAVSALQKVESLLSGLGDWWLRTKTEWELKKLRWRLYRTKRRREIMAEDYKA